MPSSYRPRPTAIYEGHLVQVVERRTVAGGVVCDVARHPDASSWTLPVRQFTTAEQGHLRYVGGCTRQQLDWLASCVESFLHGTEPLTGRGQRGTANALELRGLLAVCDPRDNGEDGTPEVAITENGILYLFARRAELSDKDRRRLLCIMREEGRFAGLADTVKDEA